MGELYADGQDFDMGDPRGLQPVLDACVRRDLFLCIHVSEPAGHDYPGKDANGPAQVAEFVNKMPSELKLLLPHWGGGFGFYELMPEIARARHAASTTAPPLTFYTTRASTA